ncbi:MAG TPA: transposase [Armatimonadota bacterium]
MSQRFNREDRIGVLHYLTLKVRERHPLTEAYRAQVLQLLRQQCDRYPARLIAYVMMPDHLHCIINPIDGAVSQFLTQFKPLVLQTLFTQATACADEQTVAWLCMDGRPHGWQDGKYSFHLYSPRLIWQKIDYIHNNPVRRGLVRRANDYPYSSFRAIYPGEEPPLVPVDREFWWGDA